MKKFLALLLAAMPIYAATYYVDATGGLDANPGTIGAPWKTINKVNTTVFNAGDSILFKAGEVWREKLVMPSSGAVGNPITLGAYGAGNQPLITAFTSTPLAGFSRNATNNQIFAQDLNWASMNALFYTTDRYYGGQANYTVTEAHTLTQVDFMANTITGDISAKNFQAQVFTMSGTSLDALIGSSDSVSGAVVYSQQWTHCPFSTPVLLSPGTSYAVVITMGAIDASNFPYLSMSITNALSGQFFMWKQDKTQFTPKLGSLSMRLYEVPAQSSKWTVGSVTTEPNICALNGLYCEKKTNECELAAAGDFIWAANNLTVYSATDPSGSIYPSASTDNLAVFSGVSYVTVDGLHFSGSGKPYSSDNGAILADPVSGVVGIVFQNCLIELNAGNGIYLNKMDNSGVSNSVVRWNGGIGVRYTGWGASGNSGNWVKNSNVVSNRVYGVELAGFIAHHMTGCTITMNDLSRNQVGVYPAFIDNSTFSWNACNYCGGRAGDMEGIGVEACGGNLFEHNEVGHNLQGGFQFFGSSTTAFCNTNTVRYNYIHDNTLGQGSAIYFNSFGADGYAATNQIYYNLIVSNYTGIILTGASPGTEVLNNVFYGHLNYGVGITSITTPGIGFTNNLFAENTAADIYAYQSTSLDHSNNSYYRAAGGERVRFNSTVYHWDDLQTFEPTSVTNNPALQSSAVYRLTSSSPCINAGVSVGLTSDYSGYSIVGNPDIGAYEEYRPVIWRRTPMFAP